MGHVDTGKTKLLDKIRRTSVQEGEVGGITQQIGATYFPPSVLLQQTERLRETAELNVAVEGLLVIDTPGHESFTNLRNRGSTLCDVAILVIDLMHGLEQQTIESLNMLRRKKAPFVVALNKVDRCYGWKVCPDAPIRDALAEQDENTRGEFDDRTARAILQLNEQGLNAALYWENESPEDTISLVPTSAHSGEGVQDLIWNVVNMAQTDLVEKIMKVDIVQCTTLEVKVMEGIGTTVDVVLVNGELKVGDTIVLSSMDGPIVTQIRALLTPPPNRELRIKTDYIHHESIRGAIGLKIAAPGLEKAVAGSPVFVVGPEDEEEDIMDEMRVDFADIMKHVSRDSTGVTVHASTLGALEALLQFLREETQPPIPVATVNIGPVHRRDVIRANLANERGQPEFATILAFDTRVDADAQEMAAELNVRIFTADIIYHLLDAFTRFYGEIEERRREEASRVAVWPCLVKILPQHVFNQRDPIVCGVEIMDGTLRVGTPLCVPSSSLDVGRVVSIQNNHKDVQRARKGQSVAIKISNESNPGITYGRHFSHENTLYSKISRESIDALKNYFKSEVSREEWGLLVKLKKVFGVPEARPRG